MGGGTALSGCLRLTSADPETPGTATPDGERPSTTERQSGHSSDDAGVSTGPERTGSRLPVTYDWTSSSQLDDWEVSNVGDAYTEVADGRLHQHVTNCADTRATLDLGTVDGPLVVDLDWEVVWGSAWGERPLLSLTVDGRTFLPEESTKDPDEFDAFGLVWHHETDGGDSNRGGRYTLHYPKRRIEAFSGDATLTVSTERSDHCSNGDHSTTDLYVEELSVHY